MNKKGIISIVIILSLFLLLSRTLDIGVSQTMTINNATGNSTNASGSVIIKDVKNASDPTVVRSKTMSDILINALELKPSSNQSDWWEYNINSTLQ